MLGGMLDEKNFLEHVFGIYIPVLQFSYKSLENVPDDVSLDFFEASIKLKELIGFYKMYEHGENVTLEEKNRLKNFEDNLYKIYDKHRDEMQGNGKQVKS